MPNPAVAVEEAAPPIGEALEKNQQATETVRQVAEELAVIHQVLDASLSKKDRRGDVDHAVQQTGEAEKRLTDSVEQLEEVNEVLEKHAARKDEDNATA